jgi:hypothetical protein
VGQQNQIMLENELQDARKEIVSDGYDMSFGEVINLYRDEEIQISPAFQRLFRWDLSRRTRFLESLLLGIPIPPIFVYQNKEGVWELIDGLQRLSTVLEFVGILKNDDGSLYAPSILLGTRSLPSLSNKRWEPSAEGAEDGIGRFLQLELKRSRIRVEILKQESHPEAKYELFQRLNSGGKGLTPQESRNCVAVMLNKPFYDWIVARAADPFFLLTVNQTETALEQGAAAELVLRFIAFRSIPYTAGLDVHEYLDDALVKLAADPNFNRLAEEQAFTATFRLLSEALGAKAFKRWDGQEFTGKFLMSVFEVIAVGLSRQIPTLTQQLAQPQLSSFVVDRAKALWADPVFQANSGAGVRGTQRLTNLLPLAQNFFAL